MTGSHSPGFAVDLCVKCGTAVLWPRHRCLACGSIGIEPGSVSGAATVFSVTTVHRPPTIDDTPTQPYAIALLDFDVGGRLMARVGPATAIGDRVQASRVDSRAMPEVT